LIFEDYVNESKVPYGAGLTAIDIDETVFRTFAKILVRNTLTGKVVVELDNQEFNSYKLKDNEEYDFGQFRDAKFFRETSIPIPQTISRIKKMINSIETKGKESRIIFLTAREDFDNKDDVLDKFRDHGIKMDKSITYIERAGNLKGGTIPERKEKILLKYLMTGKYRRVRLIDDHEPNVKALVGIEKKYGKDIENAVRKYYNISYDEPGPLVQYFGLWVKPDGSLKRI